MEHKATWGLADHSDVSEFLRRWMLLAADLPVEERSLLLTSITSATTSLNHQVERIEVLRREAREQALLKAQADAVKLAEDARRRERDERLRDEANREAREKLKETEAETRRINEETNKILKDGADYRNHMHRVLTNPELFCPHCNQAYANPTRGCWHCSTPRYPH